MRQRAGALGEGVRVQIYWNAAGIGRSAAAHYMQRQRDEMDWIRSALASLAFPYQRWADTFHRRAPGEQRRALSAVTKIWVREQWPYYGNQGHRYGARPDTSPSEPGSA
jgi:hypothetical protein